MGIYLNPGNENFRELLQGDVYVDKTTMIEALNRMMRKGNKYVCISRPRRFGKTVTGNMLAAFYSKGCDSRELFQGLHISECEDFEAEPWRVPWLLFLCFGRQIFCKTAVEKTM